MVGDKIHKSVLFACKITHFCFNLQTFIPFFYMLEVFPSFLKNKKLPEDAVSCQRVCRV